MNEGSSLGTKYVEYVPHASFKSKNGDMFNYGGTVHVRCTAKGKTTVK